MQCFAPVSVNNHVRKTQTVSCASQAYIKTRSHFKASGKIQLDPDDKT